MSIVYSVQLPTLLAGKVTKSIVSVCYLKRLTLDFDFCMCAVMIIARLRLKIKVIVKVKVKG